MKINLLYSSCDDFSNLCIRIFIVFERIQELFLQPNTHKLFPLGAKSAENPHSGIMSTVPLKKPFASKEKPPSFGIPINAHRPVITPDALPLLIK
jgi:hypothetical protein